jgi:MFS family permease
LQKDSLPEALATQLDVETEPPEPTAVRTMFRAMRHHDFRLYVIGQAISITGSWMQGTAQSWLVYRLTHSETLLGVTMFFTHIPVLLLAPVGGLVADRYSRRAIVLTTQTLSLVQALLLAVLTYTGVVTTKHVLVLAAMLGVVNAFDLPGRQTMFSSMVPKSDLISAISLNSAIFNAARIFGPSIAGLVVAALGESICFSLNALSFVAFIVCLMLMKGREGERTAPAHPVQQLKEGFAYAKRSRALITVLLVTGVMNIAYAPVLALAPFFADGIFHRGSMGLGFLTGAMGIGAVVGVLGLARHTRIAGLPRVYLLSSVLMGATLIIFAYSPWYALSIAVMPFIGFSIMRQNAGGNSLIQSVTPDEFRGRILALFYMVVTGFVPIGALLSGIAAEHFGARHVVFVAGCLCLISAALFRRELPRFQRWVDQQEVR